jgi:hypothetical protein
MNEYENMMVLENDLNSAKRKASYTFVSVSSSIDEDIQSVSDLPDSDVFSCTKMKNSKSFQDEIYDLQLKNEELEESIKYASTKIQMKRLRKILKFYQKKSMHVLVMVQEIQIKTERKIIRELNLKFFILKKK